MRKILLFLIFPPVFVNSQITGKVIDFENKEPVVGAKIVSSEGQKIITDFDGNFKISVANYPVQLITSMIQYANDTTTVNGPGDITIILQEPVQNIGTVVVSAGRRTQEIEEVPISMEIIRPSLIDNKGVNDLEQAVDQSPGVYTMDGQVSIRGGSGFAYGAGSRVLLLWNGMPLLSGYAGDTQWNAIPIEQAAQVEIMKGASSVLYGSGALNGVIALTEKEPGLKSETKVKIQNGIYGDPARESLIWWKNVDSNVAKPIFGRPTNQMVEIYQGQMFKKFGYTISSNFFRSDGYREGETELRGRISGTLYYRPVKFKRVKTGVGYNFQMQRTGNFLIWESDSLAYTPSGGADTSNAESTLTYNQGKRLYIDPYIKLIDKKNNRHNLKTRVYFAENANITNTSQSNGATIYFGEYQFQKQFTNGINLTSGLSETYNVVKSNLFGDHNSKNTALYTQYEHHLGKFDISGGVRLEYFQMDNNEEDTKYIIRKSDSTSIPFYPILRAGVHYQLLKFTHLRASIGQGIRYPSVAERYTKTSVGALNIFPNPSLQPEIGWAAEVGIKQGVKIGDWKGLLDVSGFINQYDNMMEFTFGLFNPYTYRQLDPVNNDVDAAEFAALYLSGVPYEQMIGFQAQNIEKARITGMEISFNSTGNIKGVEIISLIGYTYMNPISLNADSTYKKGFSDTSSNMLKYRFKHLAKADVELNYKNYSLGFSARYNSFMSNIDAIFEEDLIGNGTYLLPGLKDYRKEHNEGTIVFDARIGYKFKEHYRVGFIVNNVLNAEYSSRPGDIQAPRNFVMQLQMKF